MLSLRGILTVEYADELRLSVKVLFVKIKLLPKPDKKKRIRSMSRKKSEKIEKKLRKKTDKKRLKDAQKQAEKQTEKKSSTEDILDTVKLVLAIAKTALSTFFGHLRVDVARFKINVATGDAASTAIAYGAVSQATSYLLALLKDNKHVKGLGNADMDVVCDFLGESSTADIKISFSLRVWHILHLALASIISLVKHKLNAEKKKDEALNNRK